MLTNRIIVFCQLVVITITLGLIPPTVQADDLSKRAHRILKSASELDYPPFAVVRPDGSADGFSVDLLKAVTQAVDLEVNFYVGPWHEIKQKLEERHLDVLPLVAYAQERDKMFDFTVPYLRMHGTIFVRKGEKSIHSEADLKDKEVMVMRSDAAHEYAVRENLSNKLVLTESFEEALKLLSGGKHDAVVVQQLVGLQLIKKLGISNLVNVSTFQETSLKPFDKPLIGFGQKFCFAVQDGDKELLAHLNEGLAIVSANGTYDELYNKWFSPILPRPPVPFTLILKYLLFILGPILFLVAIVGLWYLKREIANKTKSLREEIEERKQAEKSLKESEKLIKSSLKEKEVLLSEIHHRVKNNMQVIISLLRLQSDKVEDKKYADMFMEGEGRIRSMALIHEQLYQSKDFANIDFSEYAKSLASGLFASHGVDTNKIKLNIKIRDVALDLENAIPCGLIINELVSNSLKHAFPDERKGKIEISLLVTNENKFELTVSDDGAGIPQDLDIRNVESMGLHLVRLLAEKQLDGKMEIDRKEGTRFHFKFKRTAYKPRI